MAESLLKLGDYSQLEKFLQDNPVACQTGDWFVQIGNIFLNMNDNNEDGVSKTLLNVRTDVANALRQTSLQFGDYQQCYSYLIKLQILCEIERVWEIIRAYQSGSFSKSLVEKLITDWDMRRSIVQSDSNTLEPLLSIRRILLNVMKQKLPDETESILSQEIGKSWVKSAEIARK